MIKVEFLGPIGRESIELDVKNLKELKELLAQDKSLSPWLVGCAVAVNAELVSSLDMQLKDGDCVSLLPPVCGG